MHTAVGMRGPVEQVNDEWQFWKKRWYLALLVNACLSALHGFETFSHKSIVEVSCRKNDKAHHAFAFNEIRVIMMDSTGD